MTQETPEPMDAEPMAEQPMGAEPDPGTGWQEFDLTSLVGRLEQAKALLEQAAALSVAQDTARIATMTHLQDQLGRDQHAHQRNRRQYR